MPQTLTCPSCGAPLDYQQSGDPAVRCNFCDNTVLLPEELQTESAEQTADFVFTSELPQEQLNALVEIAQALKAGRKIEAIKQYREAFGVGLKEAKEAVEAMAAGQPVTISGQSHPLQQTITHPSKKRASPLGCLIVGVIIILFLGMGLAAFFPNATNSFLGLIGYYPISIVQTFGEEGIGPGRFEDVRHIGVDGLGNIYILDTFSYNDYGVAYALAFNDQDALFVAASTKIIKFEWHRRE